MSKDLLFIMIVSSAVIPGIMSTAMLSLAFPDVANYFGISYQTLQWRNVIFFGVFSISILYFGSTVRRFGARRLILCAQMIFVISAIVSSYTSSWIFFLIAQSLQAIADGIMVPSQMSLIRNKIDKERWGWAFGWFHGTFAMAPLIGPILGAYLIKNYSWQAVPALVGLLQFIIFVACLRLLPEDQTINEPFSPPPVRSALTLLGILCLGQLTLGFAEEGSFGYVSVASGGLIGCVVLFSLIERLLIMKNKLSLVPWRSFMEVKFTLALFRIFCVFLVSNALSLHLPSALLATSDVSIKSIGIILTVAAVLNIIFEPVLGRLADRWDSFSLNAGLVLMLISISVYLAMPSISTTTIFLSATVMGVFAAALFGPAQLRDVSLAVCEADRDRFMGFYMFCQFVSGAFAATIFGSVLLDSSTGQISNATFHQYIIWCLILLTAALFSGFASTTLGLKLFQKGQPSDSAS
ncbi:MFS transporter [Pseudomonas sp. dw_612]|uniref:MFS transporter n=1 Tax=Pseudomonas sp. dw_612 TaxID=2720080 RepID=UPI001BD42D25|nr:MFS transporter [Pseudomonas sp. dw_612]